MLKKKVMIVDDEENFAQLVKLNLEDTGEYEVLVETEGKNALEGALKFNPDIIFLDIIMPDMDGSEVAALMEADPRVNQIPLVFLTAIISQSELASFKDGTIGGRPFLAKPVTTRKLIDCIKKYTLS